MATDWDIPIAPEQLTAEEAKTLGERVLAGDSAAHDTLILGCRKMVAKTVKELLSKHERLFGLLDGGDLHSAGLLGLVQGVRDLPNAANVLGYLKCAIRNEIADEIRRYARQPTPPVSDFPLLEREHSPWPSEADIGVAIEKATEGSLDRDKDRRVLWLRWEGRTYAEIAQSIGMRLSTVARRIRRYEEKMAKCDAAGEKSGHDASLTRVTGKRQPNIDGGMTMDPILKAFVEANTHKRPDARLKLCDLIGRFRLTLSGRDARLWPRWRITRELEAGGYILGKDSDRVVYVVGLSFQPPRQWTVDEAGRMRLTMAV